MEANNFVVKIKANGTDTDLCDIDDIYKEYKIILSKLTAKDRGSFSLNVLCILCRNLDKVPTWRESINAKDLLVLSIDCVREARSLNKPELIKTLACVYHIHRYVVRQNTLIPPELILKLSYMPFESESKHLLTEYFKTYWNIVVDRLLYIEKLKGKAIHKLLPKLTEDIMKIIDIYNTVQFCENILIFLVKKLHYIYNNGYNGELNGVYTEIFTRISSKKDIKSFQMLTDQQTLDLYVKFNDCFYVVLENASKVHFKESPLNIVVRTALSLLGHHSDIYHCLQTFYLNSFCTIFENNSYVDTTLRNITVSCEMTKKLGYETILNASYPYLSQFLRSFIEYSVNNAIKTNFTEQIQENCLQLMLHLMISLKTCTQLSKCEDCKVKSGLHDSLRLSFLLKHFITLSINYNIDLSNIIMLYNKVIEEQYNIMAELKRLRCINYEKCFRKLQTDTHNTAILLNKSKRYEFSIKLFNIYLKNELNQTKHEIEVKNVSRALYNKGICELDAKLYADALIDAFMSLIYAQDLSTDKYMSLVMDIKAKALKSDEEDQDSEELQLMSVFGACKMVLENTMYGDLKPFVQSLKFSILLKHEYNMYAKLWPSIVPVAGVWRSLHQLLTENTEDWITAENEDTVLWTLFQVVSATPSAVRTIHSDYFKDIVTELLAKIDQDPEPNSSDLRVMHTILLFLKAEYDLADASAKHGWKPTEPTMDPDAFQGIRTLPQEHKAMERAIQAVEIWTELAMELTSVTKLSCLQQSLHLAQIFVQQLLHAGSIAYGLQLAHVVCQVAEHLGDKESYVRNAGVLLYHIDRQSDDLQKLTTRATEYWTELIPAQDTLDTALMFLCDLAIHYSKCGSIGTSARLIQLAQANLLQSYKKYPDLNMDLGVGRLMEAQNLVCTNAGPTTLSAVNGTQRHYLSVANGASKWSSRRLRATTLKQHTSSASVAASRASRALLLFRRARCCAGAALAVASATTQAELYASIINAHKMDDAQVKIDNRLKYILGLQLSPDQPSSVTEPKLETFTPKKDFETMLDSNIFKKTQLSPTVQCRIPRFRLPSYFEHKNCGCYGCSNPKMLLLCCLTTGLEASMYFRANEEDIAENYFNGVKSMFQIFDSKLRYVIDGYKKLDFEKYVVDYAKRMYENYLRKVQLEVYIEASFFEMTMGNFEIADDYIVMIHEILQEEGNIDPYLRNGVMNLMVASAEVRKVIKKQEDTDLISEFDNLKLSPTQVTEAPKTPETKPLKIPPITNKVVVKDEEVPKKRKVIKLNLDEGNSDEREQEKIGKRSTRKAIFKMPVPVTSKPVLETITPKISRKPHIVVTDTAETPQLDKKQEFFTPQSTPEQFFTPLTSVKTYSKKSLRHNLVKNLEQEFATPKTEKENTAALEVPSKSSRKDRVLKRATSPGKLAKEVTRSSRRLRQPVNFSLDDN